MADSSYGSVVHVGTDLTFANGTMGSHNINHCGKVTVVSRVSKKHDSAHSYTEVFDEVGYDGDTYSKTCITEDTDVSAAELSS